MQITKLYGALGFKYDPKGLQNFQNGIRNARTEVGNFAKSVRREVHQISSDLSSLRGKLNMSAGPIAGTKKFTELREAITQTKIALDSLNARSSVYGGGIDHINNRAASGIPIWRAYKLEISSVQAALSGLSTQMRAVQSASHINIIARGAGGFGGNGGAGGHSGSSGISDRNNGLALMLGGLSGGGLFNTARTAIVAGMSNAAVFGTGALIKNVIDRGRELRASEQVLMATAKDHREYEYLNDWIIKLTDRLGTNLIESQKSFGSILMSSRAGGGNLEQAQKVFQTFSEYATTMHLSQETQKRLLTAVQQTYTIQKIHGQELNQFANAGLNMKALLVDAVKQAYGVDDKKARKMATSGQAETVKVMPYITEAMAKMVRNNNALDRALGSSQAEQGRFSNAFTRFSGNVMENGGDEALAKFFRTLTNVVDMLDKFYNGLVGINKLFNDMTNGNSSWVWFFNLLIIMLGRGAISFKIFNRAGRATVPMFWGMSRAAARTRGIFGGLKAFIETPFMRVLLGFAKRWLWIITIFQMTMTVGQAMNAHMKGYTTWVDLWIVRIKSIIVWFRIMYLEALLVAKRTGIALKLTNPDFNQDGTPNTEQGFADKAMKNARKLSFFSGFGYTNILKNSYENMKKSGQFGDAPDPEKMKKETQKSREELKQAQKNLEGTLSLNINYNQPDGSMSTERVHITSYTGVNV